MTKRSSRYVIGEVSFSAIASGAAGESLCLELNPTEPDAQKEVSKSLKAACSKAGRQCQVHGGDAHCPFPGRRPPKGTRATHLWVHILPDKPAGNWSKKHDHGVYLSAPLNEKSHPEGWLFRTTIVA